MPIDVAIGPRSTFPSWQWLGEDTAGELSKYFEVALFDEGSIPNARVLIILKSALSPAEFMLAKNNSSRIIYLPVDYFQSESHIRQHEKFLRSCEIIAVHTPALVKYFQEFAPTQHVDHHGRFFLPDLAPFKQTGYALWVGGFQNIPYLLRFLALNSLPIEVRVLTDADNANAIAVAKQVAQRLGIQIQLTTDTVNGLKVHRWSAELQSQMMTEAKAAIDIKGMDFNQQFKPPAKAQKYLCSGIPLAMNSCEITRYIAGLGLDIPHPTDERWLTRDYYENVRALAQWLRPSLTLEKVVAKYKGLIEGNSPR